MRAGDDDAGCFPTGRHYPGIAHLLRVTTEGLAEGLDPGAAVEGLPIVALDTETTGRDPAVDRVVEIAAVVYRGGAVTTRHRWLVNPGRPIPAEATAVHGIDDGAVAACPVFADVAAELLAALSGAVPLAYNADFDRAFLHEELLRAGVAGGELPPTARRGVEWIDPLVWARELQKQEKSRALGDVAARLGVALEKAHSAVDDAEAALRVMLALLADARVPRTYAAFVQEQRRLARAQEAARASWRRG